VPFWQNISVPDPKKARENTVESLTDSKGKVTQYFTYQDLIKALEHSGNDVPKTIIILRSMRHNETDVHNTSNNCRMVASTATECAADGYVAPVEELPMSLTKISSKNSNPFSCPNQSSFSEVCVTMKQMCTTLQTTAGWWLYSKNSDDAAGDVRPVGHESPGAGFSVIGWVSHVAVTFLTEVGMSFCWPYSSQPYNKTNMSMQNSGGFDMTIIIWKHLD